MLQLCFLSPTRICIGEPEIRLNKHITNLYLNSNRRRNESLPGSVHPSASSWAINGSCSPSTETEALSSIPVGSGVRGETNPEKRADCLKSCKPGWTWSSQKEVIAEQQIFSSQRATVKELNLERALKARYEEKCFLDFFFFTYSGETSKSR